MNPKYDIYEEIDRYLNKELSEAELVPFNQKLASDAEFKSLVDAQKMAHEIIIDQEMIRLKERMSKDLNQDSNGSAPWGKIILFSAVVTSAALYALVDFSPSDSKGNKENDTVVPTEQKTKAVNNTSLKEEVTSSSEKIVAGSNTLTKPVATTIDQELVSTKEETNHAPLLNNSKETIVAPIVAVNGNPQEPKQEKIEKEPVVKINCETVKITAVVKVAYDENVATIVIDPLSVKGGDAPYTYALDQSGFNPDNRFDGINEGIYHVRIKDHNNCTSTIKKEIVVNIPRKEIDDAFAPSHGERWKIPVKENAEASLTIINKGGSTVYTANISGGYPSEWDGRGNNGVELESGNYYFVIQYSARDIVKGHISIVR
jgi:hypothetical protein